MKYICTLITVSDINKSVKFYKEMLNQEVEFDHGENVSFKGGFAVHLDIHFEKLTKKKIISNNNSFELYFENDDLHSLQQKLLDNGCEFVHALQEQPWRQLVMRFYDPDYNIIEVGESMESLCCRLKSEGKSYEEISNITDMPIRFVQKSISTIEK